jgi:hypothetical protein
MSTKINDHCMCLEIDGVFIASAREDGDGRWKVSNRPGLFDRNQAITAVVLAERLAAGYDDEDPFVAGWCEELA